MIIVDRAEKLVGEKLSEAKEHGESLTPHRRGKGSEASTLSELGLTKDQSADWQRRAKVRDEVAARSGILHLGLEKARDCAALGSLSGGDILN